MRLTYSCVISVGLAAVGLSSAHAADDLTQPIVADLIQPAFDTLAHETAALADVAATSCHDATASDTALAEAYGRAFDAWITASIWRFGPTETDSRAFSLSFWPDNRGKIGKTVGALLRSEDTGILAADEFAQFSIAGKGFYALDYLMFDTQAQTLGSASYRCALVGAMTTDIAATATAIDADWSTGFAEQLSPPSARYQSQDEVRQELFKTLTTGLQVDEDLRLGRPLGSFDKPRPRRAEAWRSARSLRHLTLSLEALKPLAQSLAVGAPNLQDKLTRAFDKALRRAKALEDPQFAGVSDPASRFRVEALKQEVADIRALVAAELGPRLGVAAGFNALDGD
ncbi:peptidase M75 [Epibacterium sp. SM1979]|uniref:Peptidase M75 n=1 Tax=Tritonibacter litoralis TaxID=2662264 RepID=A0A843YCW4_9RHOB|nr:imelysin family protein [Tritonibacter litoralis]MQQ08846.1 peptidase M75 [Tritonibacter litoralis]